MILQYRDYIITGSPEEIKQFIDLMEQHAEIGCCINSKPYTRPTCPECGSDLLKWIGSDSLGMVKYRCTKCGTIIEINSKDL